MMRARASEVGFSLVELLVVAAMFALGLLGLAALQVATVRAGAGARARLGALTLAGNALESARGEAVALRLGRVAGGDSAGASRKYTRPEQACWRQAYGWDGRPWAGTSATEAYYALMVTRCAADSGPPGLQRFRVLVTWREAPGARWHSLQLERFISI